MEKKFLRQMEALLASLEVPLLVFDEFGKLLCGNIRTLMSTPLDISPGEMRRTDTHLFYKSDISHVIIAADLDTPFDIIKLCAFLLDRYYTENSKSAEYLPFVRLLKGELPLNEIQSLSFKHHISQAQERVCIILSARQSPYGDAVNALKGLLPLEDGDLFIPISGFTVALIKALNEEATAEDMQEFVEALAETALTEEGIEFTISIGNPVKQLDKISQSYEQAMRALKIGLAFYPKQRIYRYDNMVFARLMSEIPKEKALKYHALLFNSTNEKLFSQEILETLTAFLDSDLNIADTARQLYIHRNTLIYRLEKVQSQTGLDLRRFNDALIFKLLYELKNTSKLSDFEERELL
ncbi:MAG: helix-turn-helix domain-containing protein [Eubacteriales bacterium]|nr:helix-turn-helix domain-containing protein [Eubacteriales bacterium]